MSNQNDKFFIEAGCDVQYLDTNQTLSVAITIDKANQVLQEHGRIVYGDGLGFWDPIGQMDNEEETGLVINIRPIAHVETAESLLLELLENYDAFHELSELEAIIDRARTLLGGPTTAQEQAAIELASEVNRKILKFIQKQLNRLSDLDILVVGDIGTDVYQHLKTIKDPPECPGTPVVKYDFTVTTAGMAANVANNAAELVDKVELASASRFFQKELRLPNITCSLLEDYNRTYATKTRFIVDGVQKLRLDKEDTFDIPVQLEDQLIAHIKQSKANALILSDYRKGVLTHRVLKALIGTMPTVIDGHLDTPLSGLGRVDVWKVNGPTYDKLPIGSCPYAMDLVVTRGSKGLDIYNAESDGHVPAFAKQFVDVSGAGDSVTAGIGIGLAAGWSTLEGCYLGSLMAAITVQKPGTASATKSEIETLIKGLLK